ncbi:MAG: O-antigen ligase family protein [Maioricimonas sp. JB049]
MNRSFREDQHGRSRQTLHEEREVQTNEWGGMRSVSNLPGGTDALARALLLLTIAVAPGLLGAVPVRFQLWLSAGVLLSLGVCVVGAGLAAASSTGRSDIGRAAAPVPSPLFALCGLCFLGALQLVPLASVAALPPDAGVGTVWAGTLESSDAAASPVATRAASVFPAETRFQIARLAVVICAFYLGSQLFAGRGERQMLYLTLAVSGAALALFGIIQQVSWNGELFWSIPLRHGGQPFASFVNRNNAAGYLNVSLAGCLGGVMLAASPDARSRPRNLALFGGLGLLVLAGVVASLSRAGLVAAGVAMLVVTPCLYRRLGRAVVGGAAVAFAGIAVAFSLLQVLPDVMQRTGSLLDWRAALGLRLSHWSDMMTAIIDRPLLGSGLGTYRYISRPYVDGVMPGWFVNADNQYLEIAVESGLPGLLLVVVFLLLMVGSLRKLWRDPQFARNHDLAVAGTFLLVSVGLQQFTDFGITLLSTALAAAVLGGAVAGRAAVVRRDRGLRPMESGVRRTKVPIAVPCVLLGIACLATSEIRMVAGAATFLDALPRRLDSPESLPDDELAEAVARGGALLATNTDDARLWQTMAQLRILQYRRATSRHLRSISDEATPDAVLWKQSRLEHLYQAACLVPDGESLQALSEQPMVATYLADAEWMLRQSQWHCDWLPGLHYQRALLSFLDPRSKETGRDLLVRAAVLDAADPAALLRIGTAAFLANERSLAVQCWKRTLTLDASLLPSVVAVARTRMGEAAICDALLFTPDQLVAFAELTDLPEARRHVRERLRTLAEAGGATGPPMRDAWASAQLARLENRDEDAIRLLRQAVEEDPIALDRRVDLAGLLMQQGNYAEAKEHLAFACRMAPTRKDIQTRLETAVYHSLMQPATPPDEATGACASDTRLPP